MKYAVIETGGKQYLVKKDQDLDIELVQDKKKLEFEPLMVFDDPPAAGSTKIGTPKVKGAKVLAEVVEPKVAAKKVKIMKFKAKKRVKKLTGHRQKYTRIKITSIS